MTIDPADFKPQGKPSVEQMRVVYDSMTHQTVTHLYDRLVGMGYDVSRATVGRTIKQYLKPIKTVRTKKEKAGFDTASGRKAADKPAAKAQVEARGRAADTILGNLTPEEVKVIGVKMTDLVGEVANISLSERQERTRIALNIILMEMAASKAEILMLMPKDAAAFVDSMTEAARSSTVGSALLRLRDESNMIDVTPERNEVSDAIGSFLKQEGVAA